ncbi:MAG: PAS domain S-box protein [Cryomorphaceae bacterium]|nr:PAS domain S-box protein [Cryomorphaceae bacterium]
MKSGLRAVRLRKRSNALLLVIFLFAGLVVGLACICSVSLAVPVLALSGVALVIAGVLYASLEDVVEDSKLKKIEGLEALSAEDKLDELREELAGVKERIREFINHSIDVICFVEESGKINSVSRSCERLFGTNPQELFGISFYDLFDKVSRDSVKLELENCRKKSQPVEFETLAVSPSGKNSEVYLSASWSPTYELFFCVIRDVSQLKELERKRKDIILMVSHDIRSPLTTIQMCLDYITDDRVEPGSEKSREMAARAIGCAESLMVLVNDFLMLEKISEGKISLFLSEFELSELVQECCHAIQPIADRKSIQFEAKGEPVSLVADRKKVGQVIDNLLGNAVKFSPQGSRIVIDFKAESRAESEMICLEVIDQGCGIADDRLSSLFMRFQEPGKVERGSSEGFGFGLSICRSLVEMHNGSIEARNNADGIGSTFSVFLPRSQSR